MFREGTKMAGGKRGRTGPGADPERLSGGAPEAPVVAVSGPAVATATAAAVLGLAAALISVITLVSDGAKLHAGIVVLFYVPSGIVGVVSAMLQRRFVGEQIAGLRAEISRRDDAQLRLTDELERRGGEIADLTRRQQLLLAEDDLLRERMQESFVNLSMRSLTLVERQLDVIEKLEHTEENAQRLEDLFRLDHLATRMRRNSENVLVLAGADERHGHQPPATLLDVVRGAVSEIEYYERVDIGHIPRAELAGHTADDISHLLAELLENAAAYSPPSTRVTIAGRTLENRGILLTVEDEGFGVPPDRLPELNAQLQGGRAAASASDLAGLGVFVVGALAVRHGLRVQLRPRREGGLAAIVMLPAALLHGSAPSAADISHERDLDRTGGAAAGRRPPAGASRSTLQERHEAAPKPVPIAGEPSVPEPVVPVASAPSTPLPKRRGTKDSDKPDKSSSSPITDSGLPMRPVRGKANAAGAAPAASVAAAPLDAAPVQASSGASGRTPDADGSDDLPPLPKRWVARGMDETAQLRVIDPGAVGSVAPPSQPVEATPLGSAATAASDPRPDVTDKGLPKRVPRTRGNDEHPAAAPAAPPAPARESAPVAAEELRRRLSGFQMGSTAARQAAADGDIAAPGGEAR